MAKKRKGLSYADSGVDIDAGEELVKRIRKSVERTHTPAVLPGSHGAFAGLFRLFNSTRERDDLADPVLVASTDGVGTKLKIAFEVEDFSTIGIDLVAMCVNDLIVCGARPLFFLDYFATSRVEPKAGAEVIAGIARGCEEAGCALLGGETAEMPGFYQPGEFDLAGFSVGVVDRKKLIDGSKVKSGDVILGLSADGVHSNGFSLVRRALDLDRQPEALAQPFGDSGQTLGEELLRPTRLYVAPVLALLGSFESRNPVRAMAHITGGGLVENIPRVLPKGLKARIDPGSWPVPPIFRYVQERGGVTEAELRRVFNLGIGFVIVVAARSAASVASRLAEFGTDVYEIGQVSEGRRGVTVS